MGILLNFIQRITDRNQHQLLAGSNIFPQNVIYSPCTSLLLNTLQEGYAAYSDRCWEHWTSTCTETEKLKQRQPSPKQSP